MVLLVLFSVWAVVVIAVVGLCAAARRTDGKIALDEAVARSGARARSAPTLRPGTPSWGLAAPASSRASADRPGHRKQISAWPADQRHG